jgi:hypothetical protein
MEMYVFVTDAAHNQVAFHATATKNPHPSDYGDPIIFDYAFYNLGNSYSPTTGYFTAKFAGTYYFITTTGGLGNNDYAEHALILDDYRALGEAYTYRSGSNWDYVPVHAVVHLNPGQKVWVWGDESKYNGEVSMFSGFLLAHDP